MIALAAISFGSVFAHGNFSTVKPTMQTDTTKKMKKKSGKMKTKKQSTKKDTSSTTTTPTPAK